jgi:hypothetical protein
MLAGAHQAHERNDLALAEGLAREAWEGGGSFEAGLFLAIVMSHAGRPDDAETVFVSLMVQAATDADRASLAVSRSQNFLFLRRFDEAITCAEAAEATIADPAARAEVAAQRAPLLGFSGRAVEARALVDQVLPDATGRARVVLSLVGSMLATAAGQATEAIRLNDVARTTHLSLDAPLLWHSAIHRFVPRCPVLDRQARRGRRPGATVVRRGSGKRGCARAGLRGVRPGQDADPSGSCRRGGAVGRDR